MNTLESRTQENPASWKLPYRGNIGMACLIVAESAIFTIFIVAYLFYLGKSLSGPTPREALETPIFYTVCLLAALMAIPREIVESAAMDGAGPIRRFIHITLPSVKTVSLTLIFIHVIATAINFDFIWVMTQGGPLNSSETLPILIYRFALEDFDVGAAGALATMTMGFMLAVFFVYWYATRRPEGETR